MSVDPGHLRRLLAALVALAAVVTLAVLAISGHDAAVIGCQMLAMATFAYGPILLFRRSLARRERTIAGDADRPDVPRRG